MAIIILNVTRQAVLAKKARLARTFFQRFSGWMGRRATGMEEALVLFPCQVIHTCFLKFHLDVVFVDAEGRVLFTLADLPPFRFSPFIRNARAVIELPAGRLEQTGTAPGDRLVFVDREELYD
ncbi:DUF192 domain-containing protein [Moorella sulfitireducens]|uniref:DUF192 domain-containing protein n=1 Tax=Neomoorella sulfitireducens TaxID=2972948 RepID=UPI0021ACF29A|nr:DUF192 domain-containing protein [Moorella sulfitireducens]